MSFPPVTFPQFARLAPEIRLLIWREYLSAFDKPTMYLYNRNFFLKQLEPEGEDERYAGISRTPLVQVDMPASLHVDAESRGVTLQWARARDMELRWRQGTGGYVLARPFDPARDALYVSRDKWEEFCELSFEGDGLEETAARIRHLAFPAFTAYYSFTELGYLMCWFPGLKSLSCVWGALPELEYAPTTRRFPRGQRRRHLLGTDDDNDNDDSEDDDDGGTDGTDTGVDPATGELEERIAAELQPRWVLEEETAEVVIMCVRDPFDGTNSWEAGEREMWMGELEDALLTCELPEHVYDVEEERFLVEFRAVRAVQE